LGQVSSSFQFKIHLARRIRRKQLFIFLSFWHEYFPAGLALICTEPAVLYFSVDPPHPTLIRVHHWGEFFVESQ
jgi:hypothetical protein